MADGDSDVSGEITPEPEPDEGDNKPKKRKKRQGLSADLAREQIYHRLTEEEKEGAKTLSLSRSKKNLILSLPTCQGPCA